MSKFVCMICFSPMIDVYVVVLKFDEYEMKSMIIDCIIVKHVFDVYLMNLNRVC
jgi:hypothetical protein